MCLSHFLDTSILLGSRISWDTQFSHVNAYIRVAEIQRISSIRAYNEAKGVLQRNRRTILQYLDDLNNEFSRPGHPVITADSIYRFSGGYFSSINNEKIRNALSQFANKNIFDITQVLQTGNPLFDGYKRTVGAAFQRALDTLDADCKPRDDAFIRRYDICPQIYDQTYDSEQYRLMALMNYIDDVRILLDSFFLQDRIISGPLCFVTTDHTHILCNKQGIQQILTGMRVSHPREHFSAS